jgi:hypothetical protein
MIGGFDLSSYNEWHFDWLQSLTLSRNVYFAYLRACHGLEADNTYGVVRPDCDKAYVLNGGYLFAMPNQAVDDQITLLKNQIGAVTPGNLPPCIDLEWTKRTDDDGNVLVPEYWDDVKPADRIPLMKQFLDKAEAALGVVPAVYTNTNFWSEYVLDPNHGANVAFFARHPLWLVDLHDNAVIPRPWTKANFIQNHFGEKAPPGSIWYDKLDQDFFNGKLLELLALTYPGLTISVSGKVSAIVRDCQAALNARNINVGNADGLFGANTKLGVQKFQTAQGINVTGQLDWPTMKRLLS